MTREDTVLSRCFAEATAEDIIAYRMDVAARVPSGSSGARAGRFRTRLLRNGTYT